MGVSLEKRTKPANSQLTQIYFDGGCPLCRREIDFYKSVEPPETFEWLDLTQAGLIPESSGFDREDALKILHVRDKEGNLHTGVDAFVEIWSQFPRLRWLGILIKLPFFYQLAKLGYVIFARVRLLWR